MVTLKPDMTAEPDSRVDQPVVPRAVSSGEVLVLAAVVGVALLAWSGLILADVGRYTLSLAFGLALLGCPALLASAFAAGGYTGLTNLVPLLGVLAVLVVALAVRRLFGLLAGALAGL